MFNEWYQPNCELDFPVGGSQAMADALVGQGLRKYGGKLKLGAHVEEILVEGGEARGVRVRYRGGKTQVLRAGAVVSNASTWDTQKLLPESARSGWAEERTDFAACPSFMHLHAGIDASLLPSTPEMHHIWVGDWKKGVTSPQNCVLTSIASVVDPSLAPEGKHVIHAYTPGNEPYELWKVSFFDLFPFPFPDLTSHLSAAVPKGPEARDKGIRGLEEGEVGGTVGRCFTGPWGGRP